MGLSGHSKLRPVALALALLLASRAGDDEPAGDDQADEYPRRVKQPRGYELKVLAFTGWATDGTVALPTLEQVKASLSVSRAPDVREQSMMGVLAELASVARHSERRCRTAMTASGFALTIAGLLLAAKKGHIATPILVVIGLLSLGGFVAGMLGQTFYVGKRPARRLSMADLINARTFTVRKEFYAQSAMLLSALALSAEILTVVVSPPKPLAHRSHHMTALTTNKVRPKAPMASDAGYNGCQSPPNATTGALSTKRRSPTMETCPPRSSRAA